MWELLKLYEAPRERPRSFTPTASGSSRITLEYYRLFARLPTESEMKIVYEAAKVMNPEAGGAI